MMSHRRFVHLLVVQSLLVGCAAGAELGGARAGSFVMGDAWLNLSEPRGVDWSTQQLQAPGLGERRQAFVDGLASSRRAVASMPGFSLQGTWPNVGGNNWGTTPKGRLVTDLVGAANEICNGMAAGMYWDAAATRRFVYMLSQNGRFIRVPSDSANLATDAVAIDLGDTFNNTSIVMSPACSRAYVLSDNAKLYVINLAGSMSLVNAGGTVVGTGTPTANYLAPMLDAGQSVHDDKRDVLYVPRNDGNVYRMVFEPYMSAPLQTGGPYAVATSVTPKTGCTGCNDFSSYNLAAHGIAFKGRIFIGDTGGGFHDYDTNPGTPTNTTYALGTVAGIAAPPALDLQAGATTVTRPDGSSYAVQDLEPNHAFVNVTRGPGPVCAWIDLRQKTVTFSRPLFLDDNDTANDEELYGDIVDYAYDVTASGTDTTINVSDAVSVADTAGGTLSGSDAYVATPLSPSTGGIPGGTGGSDVFFRFDTGSLDAAARIKEARLQLVHDPVASTTITPPVVARVGGYDANGSTGWYPRSGGGASSAWTRTSTNPLGPGTSPVLYNRAPARALDLYTGGTFTFGLNGVYTWRITDLLVGPVPTTYNAFALTYDTGTANWGNGSTDAPRFEPVGATGQPKLLVDWEKSASIPSFPVETGPILDATRKRVYVYVSNFLFALKYDEPARWSDTYHDASFNFAPNTTYQASFLGRTTGARDQNDGNAFIRNKTTPAVAFDMSAIYVLSRGKGLSTHELAVSKITPATGGSLPGANPFGLSVGDKGVDKDAGKEISTTVNNSLTSGTTEIANPDGSRFMLIDPYSNIFGSGYALGKGGDLYFGIKDPRQIYRIGTDN
jgi:hypothetical protein